MEMRPVLLLTVLPFLLVSGLEPPKSLKILVLVPGDTWGLTLLKNTIVSVLIVGGHTVTEYSGSPSYIGPSGRYTFTDISFPFTSIMAIEELKSASFHSNYGTDYIRTSLYMRNTTTLSCKLFFLQHSIQALLKSNKEFDVVLTQSSTGYESLLVFGHKFNAPVISLHETTPWAGLFREAGAPLSIDSIPDKSLLASWDMNILDRFFNYVKVQKTFDDYYNNHLYEQSKLIKQYYPYQAPPLEELIKNVSLYLVNTQPLVEAARPYSANIIPVGGISSYYPEAHGDTRIFMDRFTEGFIYISFGSYQHESTFSEDHFNMFFSVIKNLDLHVLWVMKGHQPKKSISNIFFVNSVNQSAVLAHKNIKLFITQGGQTSILETIAAGTPVLGIPFFAEQQSNLQIIKERNIGEVLNFCDFTEAKFAEKLKMVLQDPKYKKNAVRLARLAFLAIDGVASTHENLLFWVKHVAEFGGDHLRPATARIDWKGQVLPDLIVGPIATLFIYFPIIYHAQLFLVTYTCFWVTFLCMCCSYILRRMKRSRTVEPTRYSG